MGFITAKRSFQLDNWLTAHACNPLQGLNQKSCHTLGHIGTRKEFHRITILIGTFTTGYLCQIRDKFSRLITALCTIGIGVQISPNQADSVQHSLSELLSLFSSYQ